MWKWLNTLIASNTFSENAAHILAGYGAIVTVAYCHGHKIDWSLAVIAAAAVKEYGYDAHFEIPHQTFLMNTADFLGYCVGVSIALLVTR